MTAAECHTVDRALDLIRAAAATAQTRVVRYGDEGHVCDAVLVITQQLRHIRDVLDGEDD